MGDRPEPVVEFTDITGQKAVGAVVKRAGTQDGGTHASRLVLVTCLSVVHKITRLIDGTFGSRGIALLPVHTTYVGAVVITIRGIARIPAYTTSVILAI